MASISLERTRDGRSTGRRMVRFTLPNRRRKTIRLGKCSEETAGQIKAKIESLIASVYRGVEPDRKTAVWVASIEATDPRLAGKLAECGLIERRLSSANEGTQLEKFIDDYLAIRTDVAPGTLRGWKQAQRKLTDHFGGDRKLESITVGDAAEWQLKLAGRGGRKISEATLRKWTGYAKQFFSAAVDREIIARNPFAKLRSASIGNPDRQRFITQAEIEKVLEACPDAEWRLLVALARYGGLRIPSEPLALKWGDVDFAAERITVHSPKGKKAGKPIRIIPLFPELLPYLRDCESLAAEGAVYLIERYRNRAESYFRTGMTKTIVPRAGLEPWPRIFHNLRASRQTELQERFPSHVVCAWIGNTEAIAKKHYLQVTDAHFTAALAKPSDSVPESDARARTIPGQQEAARNRDKPPHVHQQSAQVRKFQRQAKLRNEEAEADGNRTHLATLQRPHRV